MLVANISNHSVTAFVGLGDPRHVGDAPYNEGTSVRDGVS